ncbi:MAG: hypothetical protein IPH37_19485 [Burkholderiales bacterium]|nr:hypothetical protein [Burkholderiales bacterium]
MHATLARQLKRLLDRLPDATHVVELDQLRVFLQAHGAPPALRKIADGLPDLLGRVEQTYSQFERDVTLRTRSLRVSSEEFIKVNTTLRTNWSRETAISELKVLLSHLRQDAAVGTQAHPPTTWRCWWTRSQNGSPAGNAAIRVAAFTPIWPTGSTRWTSMPLSA